MTMTKRYFASVLLTVAGLSSAAFADGRVTMTDATGFYDGTDGSGGAFTATNAGPSANGNYIGQTGGNGTGGSSFLTFCIELNEEFSFGQTLYGHISTGAVSGDSGIDPSNPANSTTGGFDPISPVTAKIYQEFRSGGNFGGASTLASLADGYNSSAETTAIQNAIWYSEGEKSAADAGADAMAIWNWANNQHPTSIGNVRVLQLWTTWDAVNGYSGNSQDQLILIPLPPAATAGTAMLVGVLGLGYARRRKFSTL
jgi:hypothetical protein